MDRYSIHLSFEVNTEDFPYIYFLMDFNLGFFPKSKSFQTLYRVSPLIMMQMLVERRTSRLSVPSYLAVSRAFLPMSIQQILSSSVSTTMSGTFETEVMMVFRFSPARSARSITVLAPCSATNKYLKVNQTFITVFIISENLEAF